MTLLIFGSPTLTQATTALIHCVKYLKKGWNKKERRGDKNFKKGGGELGQGVGALKMWGWNHLTNYWVVVLRQDMFNKNIWGERFSCPWHHALSWRYWRYLKNCPCATTETLNLYLFPWNPFHYSFSCLFWTVCLLKKYHFKI